MKQRNKSIYLNPCDFFMRELSINYPKKAEDEEKIDRYVRKYTEQQKSLVEREMEELRFEELDLGKRGYRLGWCEQFKLLFSRQLIFAKREPQAILAKIFN